MTPSSSECLKKTSVKKKREDDDWTDEDDAIASGAMDEFFGL